MATITSDYKLVCHGATNEHIICEHIPLTGAQQPNTLRAYPFAGGPPVILDAAWSYSGDRLHVAGNVVAYSSPSAPDKTIVWTAAGGKFETGITRTTELSSSFRPSPDGSQFYLWSRDALVFSGTAPGSVPFTIPKTSDSGRGGFAGGRWFITYAAPGATTANLVAFAPGTPPVVLAAGLPRASTVELNEAGSVVAVRAPDANVRFFAISGGSARVIWETNAPATELTLSLDGAYAMVLTPQMVLQRIDLGAAPSSTDVATNVRASLLQSKWNRYMAYRKDADNGLFLYSPPINQAPVALDKTQGFVLAHERTARVLTEPSTGGWVLSDDRGVALASGAEYVEKAFQGAPFAVLRQTSGPPGMQMSTVKLLDIASGTRGTLAQDVSFDRANQQYITYRQPVAGGIGLFSLRLPR